MLKIQENTWSVNGIADVFGQNMFRAKKYIELKDRLSNMEFYAVDTNFAIRRIDLEGLETFDEN